MMTVSWSSASAKPVAAAVMLLGAIAAARAGELQVPSDVPRHAADALAMARNWRSDAVLTAVQARQSTNYALEFGFRSASTPSRFSVVYADGRMTSQVLPAVSANDGGPIPLQFRDLPSAVAEARREGMSGSVREASLDVSGAASGRPTLNWSLQANTDHYPYVLNVSANTNAGPALVTSATPFSSFGAPGAAGSGAPALGFTPSSNWPTRMATPSAAAEAAWRTGTAFYDRTDFRNAFAAYSRAASLGHPRAMAVLGNMCREGQGVPKDLRRAANWYAKAASLGNRGAQFSLGSMYEEGEGVPRDVRRAAQLYEVSARQGMPEAQFALGLSYEFGEGVPRNRRVAIYWLNQVARQGDGRARWYAAWLSRPETPQFQDEAEFGRYTTAKIRQRIASQYRGGNRPSGSTNGLGPSEIQSRATSLEASGEHNRAIECISSGHC